MTTLIISHQLCLGHDPGPGHPECPARLHAVSRALEALGSPLLAFAEVPEASLESLFRVHAAAMVERVLAAVPAAGLYPLERDTILSPGSRAAALAAVGGALAAVDAVTGGGVAHAFVAARPPGHHATRDEAMGFCLFNAIAAAAVHAHEAHGCARVAVIDFDVHHGNGTEAILRGREGFFYASSHEYPNYPGTGTHSEDGPCPIVNAPLAPMTDSGAFRTAWRDRLLPALRAFAPELVLVSAGFDGHRKDPLSMMQLEAADYAWLGTEIARIGAESAAGGVVSVLEGGYDLDALGASVAAYIKAFPAA
jgi:acetoin utilization deacetylase AcuC-like enzyme